MSEVLSKALYYQRRGISANFGLANVELDKHLEWVNRIARSAENYMMFCTGIGCVNPLSPAYAAYAGIVCQECYHREHITCKRCGLEYALCDISPTRKGYCRACDAEQTSHEKAALREVIETALHSCDADQLRKVLQYLRKEEKHARQR